MPSGGPLSVHSEGDFDELIRDEPVAVVLDFWAAWCGRCRAVAPELDKLARTKAHAAIVAKIDTEAFPAVSGRYAVRSIPSMILFRAEREVERVSGAMSAAQIANELAR